MKSLWFSCFFVSLIMGLNAQDQRKNVIVILVDDLGWADPGYMGSSFYETPNIDRLATQSVSYIQAYAMSPVCSPTRASIMTGKNPARLQITNWIGGETDGKIREAKYERQLPLREYTLGEAFRDAGYQTGYIGKWHLGKDEFMPKDQGFIYSFAVNDAGQPGSYFPPFENPDWPISNVPDLDDYSRPSYLTDILTDHALSFLQDNSANPFLLVLSHYAVHTPLEAQEELIEKYQKKRKSKDANQEELFVSDSSSCTKLIQDNAVYAAMLESVDNSVGRILDYLEASGLMNSTILLFSSDNGGYSTLPGCQPNMPTSNFPLRSGKGWLYEGGIRIPLILYNPGSANTGMNQQTLVTTMDYYPGLLKMTGIQKNPEQYFDGTTVLADGRESENDPLIWHFPHYHGSGHTPSSAIRHGDYKLIEWYEDGRKELYNLNSDPFESVNLSESLPEKTKELSALLQQRLRLYKAQMPGD